MDEFNGDGFRARKSDKNMDDFPEFRAAKLPQVRDAFNRVESLFNQIYWQDYKELEPTNIPGVQRLKVESYYIDGHLPAPSNFIVWVDDFELDLTFHAEMPA